MNEKADFAYRRVNYEATKQTLGKLLSDGEIEEDEHTEMVKFVAKEFEIDPDTGLDLPATAPTKKKPEDERFKSYLNLTNVLRNKKDSPATTIITWLRGHNTLEFLREWEHRNNPKFNEAGYKELMESGNKTITPKLWCEKTGAIGIISKQGNKGGTFVHPAIAVDFMMWNDPVMRYFMIMSLADKKMVDDGDAAET